MKLETKIFADAMLSEIKSYVAREVGELKASSASASRVAELFARVQELEARLAALEIKEKAARVVRLAR